MQRSAYELFLERCHRGRCLYNITPIENVPSIMKHGILSNDGAMRLQHRSIAMTDVQNRRDRVSVPNGMRLHSYANLYFNPRNPMMYARLGVVHEICVLAIDARVLNDPNCVVTDGNAAASVSRFYPSYDGIKCLDFSRIFSEWWTDDDYWTQMNNKRIECAEVLIPHVVPYSAIVGAAVVDDEARSALSNVGFDKEIKIWPKCFFR